MKNSNKKIEWKIWIKNSNEKLEQKLELKIRIGGTHFSFLSVPYDSLENSLKFLRGVHNLVDKR